MTYSNQEKNNKTDKNFKQNFPGKVIFFKQFVPTRQMYFDSFPLVLGIRIIGNKIFGCNLKLIPVRERIRIVNEMMKQENKTAKDSRIALNKLIRGKNGKWLAASFEVYQLRHIKGKIITVEENEWLDLSTSYNSLKNIKRNVLNNIVKARMLNIQQPMKYMRTVITNSIKRKPKK